MPTTLIIQPRKTFNDVVNLRALWRHRDLFLVLSLRDIKIRHKQTLLGVAWVIFQPLMSTAVFTILFGILIKLPSGQLPYPLFVFVGLTFWNFFSLSLTSTSGSLAGSESLIRKVYFPRIIVPISTIFTNLVDFFISIGFLILMLIFYKILPHPLTLLAFPYAIFLVTSTCLGVGLFLSALNVKYRDVRQILPFFIQILIFLTPVVYPVGIVSPGRQWILALNPLTSAIDITRSMLSGQITINPLNLGISTLVALTSVVIGLWYFAKTESAFADVI